MVDIFDEVEEEERARRWQALARKYLPLVVGVIIGAFAVWGAWYAWERWQTAQAAQASETYAEGLVALERGSLAAAQTAFTEVSTSGPGAYKSLALQQRAGLALRENKTTEAVALLDQAAKASKAPLVADAAALKAALLLLDTAPYADVERRLTPLIEEDRPFRAAAREALALAKIAAGRAKEARDDFVVLSSSLDAPQGLKQRAAAAVEAIDSGSAARAPAIAKAAAALPPGAAASLTPQAPGAAAPSAGDVR